jgi:hypothetical protein
MGPQVHLKLTREIALAEGFTAEEAALIAQADLGFDRHYPARARVANIGRHFAPAAWFWSARYMNLAVRGRDLVMLGYALHCAQDAVAHGTLGERHLLSFAGVGRDPDSWAEAPPGVQRRIDWVTRERLRRYRFGAR